MKKLAAALIALTFVVVLTACEGDAPTPKNSAQKTGQKLTETAFAQQQAAVPYPVSDLKYSLERSNLREKLLRFNDANKVGYFYGLSSTGQVIAEFVVKGKVSSTQSQMTTDQLIINGDCGERCTDHVPVNAPGDDGSYGENETGVFFFTTSDVYVTWNGPYVYTDSPIPISDVTIKLSDDAKPTSVGESADKRAREAG